MTRSRKIKLVAIVVTLAMVLPIVLVSNLNAVTDPMSAKAWSDLDVFYEEEIAPVDTNVTVDSFNIGETVYDPDLTSTTALPEGWLVGPKSLSTWLNSSGSGAWDSSLSNTDSANTAPNTSVVTPTADGVKVHTVGNGDFALLFPSLTNSKGKAVTNYVFTAVINYVGSSNGSAGLLTATRGSDNTFAGGSYFMLYGPGDASSHRIYKYNGSRTDILTNYSSITKTGEGGINYEVGQDMTLTVYFCDGINYYYVNGKHIYTTAAPDYYSGAALNGIGLNFSTTKQCLIKDIVVKEISPKVGITSDITLNEPTIRYATALGALTGDNSEGLRFTATVDKTAATYTDYVNGTYSADNENVKFGMLLIPKDLVPENGLITVETPNVVDTVVEKIDKQDSKSLTYAVSLLNIPDEQRDRVYVARAYMKVKSGDSWNYIYSKTKISRSYAGVANLYYTDASKETIRNRVNDIFEGSSDYKGSDVNTISFSLFADFHYLKGGYISSVADLNSIFTKAKANNVDFVLQAGDFCNDYINSPEIVNAYLNNNADLPVFGVMGNHDLEATDRTNTLAAVSAKLTNVEDVVWGTANGEFDGNIAYYYYDYEGFRIVCVDTNFFINSDTGNWERYPAWYAGPNPNVTPNYTKTNSLGDTQRAWLERVLMDAADKDIPCIVLSHASIAGTRGSSQSGDYAETQAIFRKANDKNLGTVLMVINGHHHTNHTEYVDGILYFDMNVARNGAWYSAGPEHYFNESGNETFEYVTYDADGNNPTTTIMPVKDLRNAGKTWFFEDPLSAIVHVSSNGRIVIEGMETDWLYGIDPKDSGRSADGEEPFVNSGVFSTGLY